MKCIEKEVRLPYRRGGKRSYISVVREHYLRDDIPCKVENCPTCQHPLTGGPSCDSTGTLSKEASHYSIPDTAALTGYLEVFEQPEIKGCILLQSALMQIRSKVGRQSHQRAKSLLTSPAKKFAIFSNEHYFETFIQRKKGESFEEWQQRLVYAAGVWYRNHLQASNLSIPIFIITPSPQSYSRFAEDGLAILSMEDYLECCWPALTDVHKLYQSLAESIQVPAPWKTASSTYWPKDVITDKLKKGLLFSGRLKVSNFHPRHEATVTPVSAPGTVVREILIPNRLVSRFGY